jgi:hypothetical protein
VRPALLALIDTESGAVRVWTGIGEITLDSETFYGIGTFGGVSNVEEASDLSAKGISFYLSGVPSQYLSVVLGDIRQGKQAKLWLGFIDESRTLVASPVLMFEGMTDVAKIQESGEGAVITVTAEHKLLKLRKATHRYYSSEDQKREYSGDLGFDFVQGLQMKNIVWKFVETTWEEYNILHPPPPQEDNSQG